ncbi:HNH endonuclease signature motif containing protein [Geodermatophilus nigrescens]|uniref:HNH endonuclease n=1 Tax=Geodermatophilus nigrescens TaxID=1070870 RepID=A0A1M5MNX8_9ACTN|nr:HNH endonuclease signature motif containing protein [Geodermatophilus nigrescens]SHG78897.1 HNH endonuclease [Geodermatophilus nigrescens]
MCSSGIGSGDVLDDVAALVAERNRIDARLARAVRAAELSSAPERDGLKSMASWLRGHCRLSGREASRPAHNARALAHLPVLAEAHDAGLVTAAQVAVAAEVTTPDRLAAAAAQGVDLGEIDSVLTGVAIEQEHDALVVVVKRYCTALDPDGPEPDPTEGRRMSVVRHADGTVSFHLHLDPVGAERFSTAVEAHVQADRPAGDDRTRAQRLADGAVQLADTALASGSTPRLRGVKPQVVVKVDAEDLATGRGSAQLGSGALVSAARARWLACDSNIARVVMGPDGVPLDLGRDQRLATRHIRRAAEVRDGGCVFTGCGAPTWWCDVHHLVHWLDGGPTSLENSALLCERHHTEVHSGFRVQRQPDGRWHTWRPDGTEIRTPAALRSPPLVPA